MPVAERQGENGLNNEEGISLPLYAGGLIVTLSGVMTVTTAISQGGSTAIQTTAVLLTLLGFAFSLACRHLKVQARLIEIGCLAFVAYISYELIARRMDVGWFLSDADRPDTKLATGLMWLSVLRAWTLISDDLVMFSCVLTAAMIGLIGTQDVNTVTVVYFAVFVLAMTFLLIHQNYLQSRRLASPDDRARPMGGLIPVQVGLTALCGLVVLTLGTMLIVPAQAVFANVSLVQAIRGLVGPGPAHSSGDTDSSRFSDDSTLQIGQGSSWPTTSDVLLHVSPSDKQPHYWRGRTYDLYLGTGWQSTQDVPIAPTDQARAVVGVDQRYELDPTAMLGEGIATAHSIRRQPLVASFEVRGDTDEFYYADEPYRLLLGGSTNNSPRAYADGRIDLDGHPVQSVYTVYSMPPPDLSSPDVQAHLRHAGTDYPIDVRQLYLRPPFDDQNTITTADDVKGYEKIKNEALAGLPPDRNTPFDKAMAIQDWISTHCTYSLDVKPTPPDVDNVRYFLTDSRRGYCDLFASSMVVLCRMAGIPARVATGFAPGDRDDTGFNLRALDKHAWVEVYFPGDRWEIFDPTVGTRTDGTVPALHSGTVSIWPRIWHALSSGGVVPTVLVVAILISLAYIVKRELLDRRVRRTAPDRTPHKHLEEGYSLMTRVLARLGLPRHAWETPAEYEARAIPFLTAQEAVLGVPLSAAVVSTVTKRFISARYSGVDHRSEAGLEHDLREFARAAARARRIRAWRRFWSLKPAGRSA